MKIFTIGFTKTTAEDFFYRLCSSDATKIADVRLNNVSQLAGFAKRDDLRYFARAICNMDYEHMPELAPTKSLLDRYRKVTQDWAEYESAFLDLMRARHIETISRERIAGACLLCSEDTPHHCHRRLVAEYLADHWPDVEVVHL